MHTSSRVLYSPPHPQLEDFVRLRTKSPLQGRGERRPCASQKIRLQKGQVYILTINGRTLKFAL